MIQRIWATFQTWFLLAILFLFLLPFWTYAQILTSNHGASSLGSTAIAAKTEQRNSISNGLPVRMPDGRLLASEIARIVMRHELIVAVTSFDTPPFVQELNGTLTGPDIDLVKQVAAVLKVPVRFDRSSQNHNDVVEMVAMGRADLGVSKLARTLIRSQYVLFSEPYMRLEHSLLINRLAFANIARDQSISQAVRNFNGTIGVLAGSAWEEFARQNFPKATVVPFPSFEKSVEAVKKGEVVAVYRDAIDVRSVMLSDPSLALTLRTVSFSDLESVLSVMVGQRDIVLLSLVNQVIANQTEKLTVNSLLKKMK